MQPFPDPRRPGANRSYSPAEIVDAGLCIGCGSCASSCPSANMRWDKHGFLKPAGPSAWYDAPSETVSQQCPFSPRAPNEDAIAAARFPAPLDWHRLLGSFEAAYVGHVGEERYRPQGSSG